MALSEHPHNKTHKQVAQSRAAGTREMKKKKSSSCLIKTVNSHSWWWRHQRSLLCRSLEGKGGEGGEDVLIALITSSNYLHYERRYVGRHHCVYVYVCETCPSSQVWGKLRKVIKTNEII